MLALLPAMILLSLAVSTLWGDNGLLARQSLSTSLREASDELALIERENQRLLRKMRLMEQDPVVLERMVAEELGWGNEDATIYRFDSKPVAE